MAEDTKVMVVAMDMPHPPAHEAVPLSTLAHRWSRSLAMHGIGAEHLDKVVHDIFGGICAETANQASDRDKESCLNVASSMASDVNNLGLDGQVRTLLTVIGIAATRQRIADATGVRLE